MNGIIYRVDIYNHSDKYWLSVRLDREGLVNSDAVKRLQESSLLYDGWFFKINSDKGKIISGYVL